MNWIVLKWIFLALWTRKGVITGPDLHFSNDYSENFTPFSGFRKDVYVGHVTNGSEQFSVVEGMEDFLFVSKEKDITFHTIPSDQKIFYLNTYFTGSFYQIHLFTRHAKQSKDYVCSLQIAAKHRGRNLQIVDVVVFIDSPMDIAPVWQNRSTIVKLSSSVIDSQNPVWKLNAISSNSLYHINYMLADTDKFVINSSSGNIYPRQQLNPGKYEFVAYAILNETKRSEPHQVMVIVENGAKLKRKRRCTGGNYVYDEKRSKRSVRTLKETRLPESYTDVLLKLENKPYERFALKDPCPEMLDIDEVTGMIKLKPKMRLDFEKGSELNFVVIITRTDDTSVRDEQPVRIIVEDVNDEVPNFVNIPKPFLATLSTNANPGTSVYQLMAKDDDEGSKISYSIDSGGEERFEINSETGVIRTKGSQPFRPGKEYEIGVSAQDIKAPSIQRSPTQSLKILVGERDPQFFETQYTASVPENAKEGYKIIEVKALSHQGYPITYELFTDTGSQSREFTIDQFSGSVDLLRSLDYEKDPQRYHLLVKAIENGRPVRSSSVMLIIDLVDENDNTPTFPLSQYIVNNVAETVAMGFDIIQVTATDLDSVTNSQLIYKVSDGNFTVLTLNNIGYVKSARRLDYDHVPGHTYNLNIVATDNGTPARSGSASIRVSMMNFNDEDPVFVQPIEHVMVSEDALTNTVVHVVQAFDPDGDDVRYSFSGGTLTEGPFSIDGRSGIITLVSSLDKNRVAYRLNITATDNGKCCGEKLERSSKGVVIIEVKDINNNAPKFLDCASYSPVVSENENVGTSVLQVSATDYDTGANGNVTYSMVKSNDHANERFTMDPLTGILRTADVFDREDKSGMTDYGVTVKAEDQGNPRLAGFCTVHVKIGDKNDNPPVFDYPKYETSIEERSVIGKRVLQVYAMDRDSGNNGKVEYFMKSDPSSFFAINQHTGWISIAKAMSGRTEVMLTVEARDKGVPSKVSTAQVNVYITQTMNVYPQWERDYSILPITISENVGVDQIIMRMKATSGNDDSLVHYTIKQGLTPEQNNPISFHYAIDSMNNEMLVKTYKSLDFESIPEYTLTIRATNRAVNTLFNDTRLTIRLVDQNDEIPQFVGLDENGRYRGSVAENLAPGAEVITVTATDKDDKEEFRKISYRIRSMGPDHDKFVIDPITGVVRTAVTFDREKKNEYYITLIAEDGAKSDRPNHYPPNTPNKGEAELQIHITDKNDNAPFFKKRSYTASIPENADIGSVVIAVTAEDSDEGNPLSYSITEGNVGNAFEVVPGIGEIKVRGNIDYENGPREYHLVYRVFDDKYANLTNVIITITDNNDNSPKFDATIYNVTDVIEEDYTITKSNPKYILTVRALDPDIDRRSNIRYSLNGQFAQDGTFIINENSGEIYLTRALDRDPPRGRPIWNFNVLAHDEPDSGWSLTGYAEVRVMPRDINDNAPVFDENRREGRVPEHSRAGVAIMTVMATDVDMGKNGSVIYSLKQAPTKHNTPMFTIDSNTGLISTTMSDSLDRESESKMSIIVQAKDRGSPAQSSSTLITIYVEDINDHLPKFTQKIYRATMSEHFTAGTSVASVSATDADIGVNAKLTYFLKEADRKFFNITSVEATNTGVLKVFKPVDYDVLLDPSFNLTVYVHDPDVNHLDTAYIEVFVTDYNDNAPVFTPAIQTVQVFENVTVGTSLARFNAFDRDTGVNKDFTFSIDRLTDPLKQFSVDGNGLVTTTKLLDRETTPVHKLHILAIDKGTPPQTGVGTLIVTLKDVNDNFPVFDQNYRPIVFEDEPPGQEVVRIKARDYDLYPYGAPFFFSVPCGGGCPCPDNPVCSFFEFRFEPEPISRVDSDKAYGYGIVTTLKSFDREEKKEYHLPIIMKDKGEPTAMSGTNTLTIIIGDKNDNPHTEGHKNITVFNYKGQFRSIPLGNVFAEDADDWDLVDKTFSFVRADSDGLFKLDKDTGQLSTRDKILSGVYNLEVKVRDHKFARDVISTVTVRVVDIGDDALYNSGSLRISGITAEEFVERPKVGPLPSDYGPSRLEKLRQLLANELGIPVNNVQVFSIMNSPAMTKTVDIRFAAHGSPYYRSDRLDGIVMTQRQKFNEELGLVIVMVPIDECVRERCESGGCTNNLVISNEPLIINTNGTSLIGINATVTASCSCRAKVFTNDTDLVCRPGRCLNGGKCVQRQQGYVCNCPSGFDGPRCQQTRHSFNGNGWAWYKPLEQCENSHTSFEFITDEPNGLLLYNGPIHDGSNTAVSADNQNEDFILLELRNSFPRLRINHGTGETTLEVDGKDKQKKQRIKGLSDNRWHRIDILRYGKLVKLIVDNCDDAHITEQESTQTSAEDRAACEFVAETLGENKYLNLNTPLQLGGRSSPYSNSPIDVMTKGFKGCIRNFIHNGELYDLHIGSVGAHHQTEDGCLREDRICGAQSSSRSQCGVNGTCVANIGKNSFQCVCKPGWRGSKCEIATTVKDFLEKSFIEWDLIGTHEIEVHKTNLQLRFRTRQSKGLLFKAQNIQKSEYMVLELVENNVRFRFNLGSGEVELRLTYVNISDGQWHTVYVDRHGQWVTLKLDTGEGRWFNETLGIPSGHLHIKLDKRGLLTGGNARFPIHSAPLVDNDLKDSCIDDIRLNGQWLPMEKSEKDSSIAEVVRSQNLDSGCASDACNGKSCLAPKTCIDHWRNFACECPIGQKEVPEPNVCENIDECLDNPCYNGICKDNLNGFVCECHPGWAGELCDIKTDAVVAYIGKGAILAIVISCLVLLVVLLVIIVYRRRQQPEQYIVGIDPDDDVRENIIHYDEEGVGEEDQDTYDLGRLKKPMVEDIALTRPLLQQQQNQYSRPLPHAPPNGPMEVAHFINNRLQEANNDAADGGNKQGGYRDMPHFYAYEGNGSDAGSLSSLSSTTDADQNYDYLADWGPRFSRLADMYSGNE